MAARGLKGKPAQALIALEEQLGDHHTVCSEVERNWRAYRGEMEARSVAAQWTHKHTPPHAQHMVDMTNAAMLDEKLRFEVRPRPRMYEPGEYQVRAEGARAHRILLDWQLTLDRFDEKQRPFVLQEQVTGLSPGKVYWRTSSRLRRRLAWGSETVRDPETGVPIGILPHVQELEEADTSYDGPCFEVIPVKDFVYDHSAPSLERCSVIGHRTWHTFEELKRLEQAYPSVYRGVDELKESRDFQQEGYTADGRTDRTRDRIEVWEIWLRERGKIRVYTIGNRNVLLSERANPYWHGEFPFVVFASHAEPHQIRGIPQIERVREAQEMIWSFSNLRLDGTLLATMPIVMFTSDFEDPDDFKFEPWARNVVERIDQVQMWHPDPSVPQNSIAAEQMLRMDMQNLAGGFPFTSTSEARGVQANTATEASLVASIAQRSIVSAKTSLYQCYERIGQMMLELNQQYVRDRVYVDVVGMDNAYETQTILPVMLEGNFAFSIAPMSESLLRAERRSEAQTLFTTLLQAAAALAMMGSPINGKELVKDLLESFDRYDVERFFSQAPQAPVGMGSPPAANGGAGVTNPALAAGPTSPSNESSISPAQMMQGFLAGRGAGVSS